MTFEVFKDTAYSILKTIEPIDFLDVAILAYIIYVLIKFIKETRAGQIVKGVTLFICVYFLAAILNLKVLTYIISQTLNIGILAIVVLFQPEIRRAFEKVGHAKLTTFVPGISSSEKEFEIMWNNTIKSVCDSCRELSATKTGALIVIEQKTKLGEQIENGTVIDALPSKELFGNIFYPKTPLHDGAAIVREGKIIAAACFLPKPAKEEIINKKLGSRHRAAIGMSENSDAIIIVVSEETGQISVAENGILIRDFTPESLREFLHRKLIEIPAKQSMMQRIADKKDKKENRRSFRLKKKSRNSKYEEDDK